MKAILMSIRPEWVAKILNGEKTIEIRKKFPKDYVGWVYIYCTKSNKDFAINYGDRVCLTPTDDLSLLKEGITTMLNGKVVARFWCDKVEEINFHASYNEDIRGYRLNNIYSTEKDLLEKSCLTQHELYSYLPHISPCGKAIHITNLEIFDKPKDIREFYHHFTQKRCERPFSNTNIEIDDKTHGLRQPTKGGYEYVYPLTRAPESWQYIEV